MHKGRLITRSSLARKCVLGYQGFLLKLLLIRTLRQVHLPAFQNDRHKPNELSVQKFKSLLPTVSQQIQMP